MLATLNLFLHTAYWYSGMLTFAERLNEAHEVRCLAGAQDLAQGPDVVLSEAERLDFGQFLSFGVTGNDFSQTLQSIVQPVHAVPLPGVSFHPTHLKPAETYSGFVISVMSYHIDIYMITNPSELLLSVHVYQCPFNLAPL